MNDRERLVCARVKLFREDKKWPQPDFAKIIGISKNKLACIEYGYTPLRYKTGVDLCSVFDVNAEWLMTGKGEMHGGAPALWIAEFPLEKYGKKLFSEVYDSAPWCFIHVVRVYGLNEFEGPTPGFDPGKYLTDRVVRWLRTVKFKTPLDAERFARSVNDFAEKSLQGIQRSGIASQQRISREIAERAAASKEAAVKTGNGREIESKLKLDIKSPLSDGVRVQNQFRNLKDLVSYLKTVTAARGAKAALAREFGVTRQAVNQWLSGESAPSADIAIRLQHWKPKPAK